MTQWCSKPRARQNFQLNAFDGLGYDSKAIPSDIDGILDMHNKGYIIYEAKYRNKDVPFGQRLLLSRMVDDFTKIGKHAIALICEHHVDNPDVDVTLADCLVRECYYHGDWRKPPRAITAKEVTDQLLQKWK